MFGYLRNPRNSDEAIRRMAIRSFLAVGLVAVAVLAIVTLYFFGAVWR